MFEGHKQTPQAGHHRILLTSKQFTVNGALSLFGLFIFSLRSRGGATERRERATWSNPDAHLGSSRSTRSSQKRFAFYERLWRMRIRLHRHFKVNFNCQRPFPVPQNIHPHPHASRQDSNTDSTDSTRTIPRTVHDAIVQYQRGTSTWYFALPMS